MDAGAATNIGLAPADGARRALDAGWREIVAHSSSCCASLQQRPQAGCRPRRTGTGARSPGGHAQAICSWREIARVMARLRRQCGRRSSDARTRSRARHRRRAAACANHRRRAACKGLGARGGVQPIAVVAGLHQFDETHGGSRSRETSCQAGRSSSLSPRSSTALSLTESEAERAPSSTPARMSSGGRGR